MRGGKFKIFIAGALLLYCIAVVARYGAGYPELFSLDGYVLYLWRTALSRLLLVFVLWLSAFGLGGAVFGRWLPVSGTLLEEGLMKSALGLIPISYAMFLLGIMGLLYPVAGYAVLAVGLGLGARAIMDYAGRVSRLPKTIKPSFAGIVLVLLSAYFLVKGFYYSLLPPTGFDVLMYHYGVPKLYIDAHSIFPTRDISGSSFPYGVEMLYMLGMLLEGPVSANLINYSFAVAGGLATAVFARRFMKGISPLPAFALYVSIPMVLWLMPQAYIELALAAYTMLALHALLAYFREDDTRWLIVAGLLAGFTLAIKYTACVAVFIMAAGILFHRLAAARAGAKGALVPALAFSGLAALACLPWYVKNAVFYHNPLYPLFAEYFEGGTALVSANVAPFISGGPARVAWKFVSSLWLTSLDSPSYQMGGLGGPGPYFLMFVPGLALFRGIEREVKYLLAFCLVFFMVVVTFGNVRYLSPIFPALAVLAAYPVGRLLIEKAASARIAGYGLLVVFAFSALLANTDRGRASEFASASPEAADRYYSGNGAGYLASYDTWKWINQNLPQDAVIYQLWDDSSVFFRGRKTIGSSQPFGDDSRAKLHVIQGINGFGGWLPGQKIIANLKGMGAGYLIINANREGRSLPDDPYFQQNVTLMMQDRGVFLFRLNP